MSIPKVLHRIVLKPMKPVGLVERYWQQFSELHPGWALHTWASDAAGDWPVTGHLLSRCNSPAQKADLIRLELLWRQGGVYVDTDCEPLRPLDDLLDAPGGAFVGRSPNEPNFVESSVIGATAGHPALRAMLDAVLAGFDPSLPPNITTGPHLLTRIVNVRGDVTVLPPTYFGPELPNSDPLELRPSAADLRASHPEARVVHRWAHSWAPKPPMKDRARAKVGHARWLVRERWLR